MSELPEQELARRIRVLLKRDGRTDGNDTTGYYSIAAAGRVLVTLTPRKMAVYLNGTCVYTEDGKGKCTGFKTPDTGYVLHDLRNYMVLDDLASV